MGATVLLATILSTTLNSELLKEKVEQKIDCQIEAIGNVSVNPECKGGKIETATATSEKSSSADDKGLWDSIWGKAKDVKNKITDKAKEVWSSTKEKAKESWKGTKAGAKIVWEWTKENVPKAASAVWEWAKENKEYIAAGVTVGVGVGLLFIPGGQGFGAAILFGAAFGGGVTYFTDGDAKTIARDMSIGGIAGLIGGGIGAVVGRGAMALLPRASPIVRKILPGFVGGFAGGGSESLTDDALRGKDFDLKKAIINGAMAGGILFGSIFGGDVLNKIGPIGPMAGQKAATKADEAAATPKSKQAEEAKDVIAKADDEDQLVNELIEKEIDESSLYQSLREKYPEEKARAIARNIEQGNAFNRKMSTEYPNNEVYIENSKAPSGYVRLGSYNPTTGEIVSRKYTQLADIQPQTAKNYINELKNKYPPGAKIADVKTQKKGADHQNDGLAGDTLKGEMILEVPVQKKEVPQEILDYASDRDIIIRDEKGNILN
ncbi:hypothetical protein [Mechercharimyces sp. CAU 1602]|uniref:hypothetical protein n=1 Tax=Mechercharimyces sp. CAU 1602 TaxID=2973933 RepID=UPI0021617415|nr:hypothetical protein [Mechercharimyces sp. CAU 1602]MCS1350747.1 hypothetical protein [Mechercharimyces sp. CAU 1602]